MEWRGLEQVERALWSGMLRRGERVQGNAESCDSNGKSSGQRDFFAQLHRDDEPQWRYIFLVRCFIQHPQVPRRRSCIRLGRLRRYRGSRIGRSLASSDNNTRRTTTPPRSTMSAKIAPRPAQMIWAPRLPLKQQHLARQPTMLRHEGAFCADVPAQSPPRRQRVKSPHHRQSHFRQ